MAEEKVFTIPLWHKAAERKARQKRTPYAIKSIRTYLSQHTGAKTVKLGGHLNSAVWARGKQKPPHNVRVTAVIDGDVVRAELFGQTFEEFKPVSVAKREKLTDKLRARMTAKEQQTQDLEKKIEGKKEEEPGKAGEQGKPAAAASVPSPAEKPAEKPAEAKPAEAKPAEAKPEPKKEEKPAEAPKAEAKKEEKKPEEKKA